MDNRIQEYIGSVFNRLNIESEDRIKIQNELYSHIGQAAGADDVEKVLSRLGKPEDMAKEIINAVNHKEGKSIDKLIKNTLKEKILLPRYYEYKSNIRVFGLPLIHIKKKTSGIGMPGIAKGIIAGGDISIGIIAYGKIAFGLLGFGAVSAGILSLGGAALGLLSIGGVSIGGLSLGGIAAGFGAIGGCAFGKIALGKLAGGTIAMGNAAFGNHVLTGNFSSRQVVNVIKSVYPGLNDLIAKIFTMF